MGDSSYSEQHPADQDTVVHAKFPDKNATQPIPTEQIPAPLPGNWRTDAMKHKVVVVPPNPAPKIVRPAHEGDNVVQPKFNKLPQNR